MLGTRSCFALASDEAKPVRARSAHVDGLERHAEQLGDSSADLRRVGSNLRSFRNDQSIDVGHRKTALPGKLSRPLCAYPTLARYRGPGDAAEAGNFECK